MPKDKCRVCLNEGLLTSIFKKRNSLMISTKLMSLTKIQIYPDDGLPDRICSNCIKRLDDCIEFIQLCENSDLKLRNLIIENQNTCGSDTTEIEEHSLETDNYSINNDDVNKYSSVNYTIKDLSISDYVIANQTFLNEDVTIKEDIDKVSNISDNFNKIRVINGRKAQKEQCFTCGKVMSSRFRLKTHLRTHTGERPYSCPHCNKNFSLAQNLKVHIRVHTGEKPLQCSVCGAAFAQSAGLAAHRRKHTGQTPYACTLCPRSFRTVGHLQYHIRRHTGEKNFECDTCARAFITRSDLKQHLVTHSGDKPHVCSVCGLRLARAAHLKRHVQCAHKGDKLLVGTQCPTKQEGDSEEHEKEHDETKNTKDNLEQ